MICEVVSELRGGFMVDWVVKEECEEQSEPECSYAEAVLLVYEQEQQKSASIVEYDVVCECDGADKDQNARARGRPARTRDNEKTV